MSLELVKVIAALCATIAGDTNSWSYTASQVTAWQRECHAFYAECTEKKPIRFCMVEREAKFQRDVEKSRQETEKAMHGK